MNRTGINTPYKPGNLLMSEFHDCPVCGTMRSAYGDHYCGSCESKWLREQEVFVQQEISCLNRELSACSCAEGLCSNCVRAQTKILSLQGREADAISFLNM